MTSQLESSDEGGDASHGISAWDAAVAAGLDMSLVEVSLRKTPWERMRDHDAALRLAELLGEAKFRGHEPA